MGSMSTHVTVTWATPGTIVRSVSLHNYPQCRYHTHSCTHIHYYTCSHLHFTYICLQFMSEAHTFTQHTCINVTHSLVPLTIWSKEEALKISRTAISKFPHQYTCKNSKICDYCEFSLSSFRFGCITNKTSLSNPVDTAKDSADY